MRSGNSSGGADVDARETIPSARGCHPLDLLTHNLQQEGFICTIFTAEEEAAWRIGFLEVPQVVLPSCLVDMVEPVHDVFLAWSEMGEHLLIFLVPQAMISQSLIDDALENLS